jgi:glycosyltransferase involved in cell wall biosynthesis
VQINSNNPRKTICIVASAGRVLDTIARIYGTILQENGYFCFYIDSRPFFKIKMLFDLVNHRHSYEWIHVHSSGDWGDIPLIWTYIVSRLLRKRVIITYHCGSPDDVLARTAFIVNIFFNAADLITVPSEYSRGVLLRYNPGIAVKLIVLPNFIDPIKWKRNTTRKNRRKVITVSQVDKHYIYRKGLLLFIDTAKLCPEMDFYIIGNYDHSIQMLKQRAPPNVYFTGYVTDEELRDHYNTSFIYCQLSVSESFGYALAEAMLCDCIPVVTRSTSLPEIVGNAGIFIKSPTPESTAKAIVNVQDEILGKKARERIIENFSIERRKHELLNIFSRLTGYHVRNDTEPA